jgi:hypothetical protein
VCVCVCEHVFCRSAKIIVLKLCITYVTSRLITVINHLLYWKFKEVLLVYFCCCMLISRHAIKIQAFIFISFYLFSKLNRQLTLQSCTTFISLFHTTCSQLGQYFNIQKDINIYFSTNCSIQNAAMHLVNIFEKKVTLSFYKHTVCNVKGCPEAYGSSKSTKFVFTSCT